MVQDPRHTTNIGTTGTVSDSVPKIGLQSSDRLVVNLVYWHKVWGNHRARRVFPVKTVDVKEKLALDGALKMSYQYRGVDMAGSTKRMGDRGVRRQMES